MTVTRLSGQLTVIGIGTEDALLPCVTSFYMLLLDDTP